MSEDKQHTILVVDDEEMNLIILSKLLNRLGYQIKTAKSGREALDLLESGNELPSLVLMDLMMPEMNGWEATEAIKKSDKLNHLPVIAVTALGAEMDNALKFGFDGFCAKPINFANLEVMIKEKVTA